MPTARTEFDLETLAGAAATARLAFAGAGREELPDGDHEIGPHAFVTLRYRFAGDGELSAAGGDPIPLPPGTLAILAPGLPYRIHNPRRAEDWFVGVTWHPVPAHFPGCTVLPRSPRPKVVEELAQLTLSPPRPDVLESRARDHRAAALLLDTCAAALDEQRRDVEDATDVAGRAYDLIQRTRGAIDRVEHIAKRLGIGPDHLRHVFRRRHGIGVKRCLTETRIARARALLTFGDARLAAVAERCGFANERHLCTVFREETGETPGAFRTRMRGGGGG